MNAFTIRDIENLCGIKAHTLRIWEQRYKNLVCPKRKPGSHRQYDADDLKYLLRISLLYHSGHKISKIAKLSEKEICQLAMAAYSEPGSGEIFIVQLAAASIDFDQERFDKILHHSILHFGFEKAMLQVIFPFLRKIGMLWLTGHIIPAQEHFASNGVLKKMMVAINGFELSAESSARKIVLFSPSEELHEIPLLFLKYLLKKSGVQTVYFGANTDIKAIKCYCDQKKPTHLLCNLLNNLMRCEVDEYISRLLSEFPGQQIVVSGPVLGQTRLTNPRLRVLPGFPEFFDFAKEK